MLNITVTFPELYGVIEITSWRIIYREANSRSGSQEIAFHLV
jgi:hypothetical protein